MSGSARRPGDGTDQDNLHAITRAAEADASRAESAVCADSGPPGRPGESRTVRARPGTAPWRAHARPAPAGQRMPRPAAPLALPPSRRSPLRNDAGRRAAHSAGTAPGRPFAGPVRGRPWKTDGVPDRATGTDAVRYTSVDTATYRPAVTHPDTGRDKKETARLAENSQLAGRFRRWWQVLGSNQRRLSRRFYRPLSFCTSHMPLTSTYVL